MIAARQFEYCYSIPPQTHYNSEMIQGRAFRWDLLYGIALAVILGIVAAVAWIQTEAPSSDSPATTVHPTPVEGAQCDR